jgi:hypothetical protein
LIISFDASSESIPLFELSSVSDEFCKILKIAILVCLVSILRHNSTNTTKKAARPETVTD